jgi:hypothetical protein
MKSFVARPAENFTPTLGTSKQRMADCLPFNLRVIPGIAWQGGLLEGTEQIRQGGASWISGERPRVKTHGQR